MVISHTYVTVGRPPFSHGFPMIFPFSNRFFPIIFPIFPWFLLNKSMYSVYVQDLYEIKALGRPAGAIGVDPFLGGGDRSAWAGEHLRSE